MTPGITSSIPQTKGNEKCGFEPCDSSFFFTRAVRSAGHVPSFVADGIRKRIKKINLGPSQTTH